jgi:hypothetical protein
LLVKIEIDPLGSEFFQEAEEIDQAATQPIHCPCGDHIDLAASDGVQ